MRAYRALVGFGFRLLYREFAFTYDMVSRLVSFGAWGQWQRAALSFLPAPGDGWVLEVAHGTGDLQHALAQGGWRSVGVDLSRQMGRIAGRKLSQWRAPVRLARAGAARLPFGDGVFAAVVCTFPTPFIGERAVLAELARVLRPGGVLVVVPGAMLTGRTPSDVALRWLYRVTGQRADATPAQPFVARFEAAGFQTQFHWVAATRSAAQVLVARPQEQNSPGVARVSVVSS